MHDKTSDSESREKATDVTELKDIRIEGPIGPESIDTDRDERNENSDESINMNCSAAANSCAKVRPEYSPRRLQLQNERAKRAA